MVETPRDGLSIDPQNSPTHLYLIWADLDLEKSKENCMRNWEKTSTILKIFCGHLCRIGAVLPALLWSPMNPGLTAFTLILRGTSSGPWNELGLNSKVGRKRQKNNLWLITTFLKIKPVNFLGWSSFWGDKNRSFSLFWKNYTVRAFFLFGPVKKRSEPHWLPNILLATVYLSRI